MLFTIVDALQSIKGNVAQCLSGDAIHRACRDEGYQWRERELNPAKSIHAFLLQVLHGNTARAHTIRLAGLSCSARVVKKLSRAVFAMISGATERELTSSLATNRGL